MDNKDFSSQPPAPPSSPDANIVKGVEKNFSQTTLTVGSAPASTFPVPDDADQERQKMLSKATNTMETNISRVLQMSNQYGTNSTPQKLPDSRTRLYSVPTPTVPPYQTFGYTAFNQNHQQSYQHMRDQFSRSIGQYPNHCHSDDQIPEVDKSARRKLIFASLLCLLFMLVETVGGLLANSLAVASDAAHLLTDFASFMISLFSLWLAHRPASKKMSFGYYRAEVIGALTSVLLIWVVTGVLVLIAIQRLRSGEYEVDARIMLITASFGVLVNIVMGISLQVGNVPHSHHGHHHHDHNHSHHDHHEAHSDHSSDSSHEHNHSHSHINLNVRAAFIHVIGDLLQSVGVLIAAIVIYFYPNLGYIDPICTFIFSVLVLVTTVTIIKDVLNVLMEGIPKGIDLLEVQRILFDIPGVIKVHNLRIWSLSLDKIALSTHLAVGKNQDQKHILRKATKKIKEKFGIYELTIQVEEYKEEMNDCNQCNEIQTSAFLTR